MTEISPFEHTPRPDQSREGSADQLSAQTQANKMSAADVATIARQNFKLLGENYEPHTKSQIYFLRHAETQAVVVAVQNSDPHLRSELRFRTLPSDSTGVFHKLEHGVLSESKRLPIADAFSEMRRSLLLTDANALTLTDYTCYYACGADAFSVAEMTRLLAEVTLKGRPSEQTYLREHGHLRPDKDSPSGYRFGGVVYDEMLGLHASRSFQIGLAFHTHFFPESPVRFLAGGDPLVMQALSLAQYQKAYDDHYQPSQALIGLYGNTPLSEKLSLVNEVLDGFKAGDPPESTPAFVPFKAPQTITVPVPADTELGLPLDRQAEVMIGWKFEPIEDFQTRFEVMMLLGLLSASEASPFKQAYQASNIQNVYKGASKYWMGGEEVIELSFARSTVEDLARSEATALGLLKHFSETGFPREAVESVLSSSELYEEKCNRSVYLGNSLLDVALGPAMLGRFEIDTASVAERAATLRAKLDVGERVFGKLIDTYFLSNPNRLTLHFLPDESLVQRQRAELEAQTAKVVAALSPEEERAVVETAARMQAVEMARVSEENLAVVPKATLGAHLRTHVPVEREIVGHEQATIVLHNQDLGLHNKLDFVFDVSHLAPEELPFVQFLSVAMAQLGPKGTLPGQYVTEMGQLIGTSLSPNISTSSRWDRRPDETGSIKTYLSISGTTSAENTERFIARLLDVVRDPQLDNTAFMTQLSQQIFTRFNYSLGNPNKIATFLSSRLCQAISRLGEHSFATQEERALITLSDIQHRLDRDPVAFQEYLTDLHARVFRQGALTVNAIGSDLALTHLLPRIKNFAGSLSGPALTPITPQQPLTTDALGIETPVNSNFVGLALQLRDANGTPHLRDYVGLLACEIMNRHLETQVRRLGGAYASSSGHSCFEDQVHFTSCRDPEIERTLRVYEQAVDFLLTHTNEDLLDRARVSAFQNFVAPRSPEELATLSFLSYLYGYSDQIEDTLRCTILDTTVADVKAFGERLKAAFSRREFAVRVYANSQQLARAVQAGVPLVATSRF